MGCAEGEGRVSKDVITCAACCSAEGDRIKVFKGGSGMLPDPCMDLPSVYVSENSD